jgi:hypothetical protein
MGLRIQYKEVKPGIFVSVNYFRSSTTDAIYEVSIDMNELRYKIKNVHTERIYEGNGETGNVESFKHLAHNAKEHLKKFGVHFDKEKRSK